MARLRYNGLRAALGASLTNSATSVTFAAALTHSNGTNVPTLAGIDYIPLAILDSSGHLSEIVHLTAYTAGATTGTIRRGQEGTAGVTHASGDAVIQGALVADIAGHDTYDIGVTAELGSSVVHRWKFDEASGTSVADSVGSLTGTLSGTVTRDVTSRTGKATTFGASALMVTSGLGNIPIGNTARCFVVIYRTTSDTIQQTLVGYGTNSTRQWWDADHSTSDGPQLSTWGDDFNPAVRTPVVGPEILSPSGRNWRMAAFGYNPNTQEVYAYRDGVMFSKQLAGTLATPSTGNFQVGYPTATGTTRFSGDMDDVLVANVWPGKRVLDALLAAAAR